MSDVFPQVMNKGQGPDWAKFGLEPNERQPLNPQQQTSSSSANAAPASAAAHPPPPPAAPLAPPAPDIRGALIH